jgi:hypothetical protein
MSEPPCPDARPCASCPYRKSAPSGLWAETEYALLPLYDLDTWAQPPGMLYCHQRDGRLCAGFAAVHDMDENLGLRFAISDGTVSGDAAEAIRGYSTTADLWPTGFDAARHGMRDLGSPSPAALAAAAKLTFLHPELLTEPGE